MAIVAPPGFGYMRRAAGNVDIYFLRGGLPRGAVAISEAEANAGQQEKRGAVAISEANAGQQENRGAPPWEGNEGEVVTYQGQNWVFELGDWTSTTFTPNGGGGGGGGQPPFGRSGIYNAAFQASMNQGLGVEESMRQAEVADKAEQVRLAGLGQFPTLEGFATMSPEEQAALQTRPQALFESFYDIPTAGRSFYEQWLADQFAQQYSSFGVGSLLAQEQAGRTGIPATPQSFQQFLTSEGPLQSRASLRGFLPRVQALDPTVQRQFGEILPGLQENLTFAGLAGQLPSAFAGPLAGQITSPTARGAFEITPGGASGGSFLNYLASKYRF